MTRGTVLELEPAAVVHRAKLMANHPGTPHFDPSLPPAPEGYYRLSFPNGGTDPTAPDHYARWSKDGSTFVNVTGDCVSLVAWASGFDRFQPKRGAHLQGGAINCDFMAADANGPAKCFERLARPEPGCIVTYPSLADQDHDGERDGSGHTGIVIAVPPEWDERVKECWLALTVIDCAHRTPHLSDQYTTGRAWFGARTGEAGKTVPKGSVFVRSVMRSAPPLATSVRKPSPGPITTAITTGSAYRSGSAWLPRCTLIAA